MNQTANCNVINTHWVYSHRYRQCKKGTENDEKLTEMLF
jgi:hypothetical protein